MRKQCSAREPPVVNEALEHSDVVECQCHDFSVEAFLVEAYIRHVGNALDDTQKFNLALKRLVNVVR